MNINRLTSMITAGLLLVSIGSCAATENDSIQAFASTASISTTEISVANESGSVLNSTEMFTERDLVQSVDLNHAEILKLVDGEDILVDEEGVYVVGGRADDSMLIVDAGDEAKVQLVLNELEIVNKDKPAIYIKSADKVFITTTDSGNSLSVSGSYKEDGDTNLDAVIFSRSDLVMNGTGTLEIASAQGNGISSKDDLKITGGKLVVEARADGLEANDSIRIYNGDISIEAGSDALHSENDDDPLSGYIYIQDGTLNISAGDDGIRGTSVVQIDGGDINILTCLEGIEATQIQINEGSIDIYAKDDGLNATAKSTIDVLLEVYGGDISINMANGDTDAFDSNGDLFIYGGSINVTAQSSFDADGQAMLVGGDVTINGEAVTELPENRGGRRRH